MPDPIVINKKDIDKVVQVKTINHSQMGNIAHLMWGYDDGSGRPVRQLNIIPTYNSNRNLYLSFDGNIKFKEKGFNNDIVTLRRRDILYPSNGYLYKMSYLKPHFFNEIEPLMCNLNYDIDVNNASMIMDNISIYDEHYENGVMINLRVSFEGTLKDGDIDGNVHVLCVMDEIIKNVAN